MQSPPTRTKNRASIHLTEPYWEATQHLIRTLERQGEVGTATLLMELDERGENARDLAYRLYSICEAKGWTSEAIAYNSLVILCTVINFGFYRVKGKG
jgi:hypothetical protein